MLLTSPSSREATTDKTFTRLQADKEKHSFGAVANRLIGQEIESWEKQFNVRFYE